MPTKKKPSFPGTCAVCGKSFTTNDEVYMDKEDGKEWIICIDKECYDKQGGRAIESKDGKPRFTPTKFPINDFGRLYALAQERLDSFITYRISEMKQAEPERWDEAHPPRSFEVLSYEAQAVFIESMVRSMVSGCKPT